MAQASVRVNLHAQGANLRVIARELRRMDDAHVKALFKRRLTDAARPFVPKVAASALAIPTTGEKHTGLRARIAACAGTASWDSGPRSVSVAVQIQPQHMPDHEKSLPLYMEGAKPRWRHPVFGTAAQAAAGPPKGSKLHPSGGHGRGWTWVSQTPHPYFYRAVQGYGRASGVAMQRALDDITHKLNG